MQCVPLSLEVGISEFLAGYVIRDPPPLPTCGRQMENPWQPQAITTIRKQTLCTPRAYLCITLLNNHSVWVFFVITTCSGSIVEHLTLFICLFWEPKPPCRLWMYTNVALNSDLCYKWVSSQVQGLGLSCEKSLVIPKQTKNPQADL